VNILPREFDRVSRPSRPNFNQPKLNTRSTGVLNACAFTDLSVSLPRTVFRYVYNQKSKESLSSNSHRRCWVGF